MATHSSGIPGTGEPGGLPSMGSHRVGNDWSDLAVAAEKEYGTKSMKTEKNGGVGGTKEEWLICLGNGFDMENYAGDGLRYG